MRLLQRISDVWQVARAIWDLCRDGAALEEWEQEEREAAWWAARLREMGQER